MNKTFTKEQQQQFYQKANKYVYHTHCLHLAKSYSKQAVWVLHILKGKLKRFTTSRKKRLKRIIIRMNKYVNKQKQGYNTLD